MNTHYQRINVTLPVQLLDRFEDFCFRQGMTRSGRIAVLIEQDLERAGRGSWRKPLNLKLSP